MSTLADLVEHNQIEQLIINLEKGDVDVNERNIRGETALWRSCYHNRIQVFNLLMQHINIQTLLMDSYGNTPFSAACYTGNFEIVHIMLKDGRNDVCVVNRWGWTPLMQACLKGKYNVVQILLAFDRRLDVDVQSQSDVSFLSPMIKKGLNAAQIANESGKEDVVSLLKQYQSDHVKTRELCWNQLRLKGLTKQEIFILAAADGDIPKLIKMMGKRRRK